MTIAFCTTLRLDAATLAGRILPLSRQLAKQYEVHIIHLGTSQPDAVLHFHSAGPEPFTRTTHGKERHRGLKLLTTFIRIAIQTAAHLQRIRPDVIVIAKPLPHNTGGVTLYRLAHRRSKIILDADDFELTANQLTSLLQRSAVHWSERQAATLAHAIIVATPFLQDHFQQLTSGRKPVHLIPTGLDPELFAKLSSRPPPAAPRLLYLGSLSAGSGHRVDLLPSILALVRKYNPAATLTIAGFGDDENALRTALAQTGLNRAVRWVGRFTNQDVAGLVVDASLIIDPIDASITQRAKSSFRTLVAAAAGRPVVTSNVGIRPQLLPPDLHDRFFANAADPTDYAAKISHLLTHPLTVTEQTTLQKHAVTFSWTELARQYITVLTV